MGRAADGVSLLNDVHRWIAAQSDEIESLRGRHQRLTAARQNAIAACAKELERDSSERKKQVNEFGVELEQYTLRKFDLLKDDVEAAHLQANYPKENTGSERRQKQIHDMSKDLDRAYKALGGISKAWVDLIDNCCEPTEFEKSGRSSFLADTDRPASPSGKAAAIHDLA
mmetsp:Transcript_1150/g.2837  ORF Transcript_1150/g.2837 Transcript_1150/m.2837 type:complete len:170 (+) Transcript_1150:79-588(+)